MSASNAGRIGVWGRSGSGKSSYVKQAIKARKRVVVFDPMEEYGAQRFTTVRTVDAVRIAMRDNWQGFRVALVPQAGKESAQLSALSRLLIRAQEPYRRSGGQTAPLTFVVEEMNTCFPISAGVQRAPGFGDVCSRGRHFGIEVFGLSQRIAEVDTRFRGNCTETVVLMQKGPRDTKAAAAELGIGTGPVTKLNALDYLHEKDGVITAGKISFSRSRAANTNAPPASKKRAA